MSGSAERQTLTLSQREREGYDRNAPSKNHPLYIAGTKPVAFALVIRMAGFEAIGNTHVWSSVKSLIWLMSAWRLAWSGSMVTLFTSCVHWSFFQPELFWGSGRQPGELLHSVAGFTWALLSPE